VAFHGTCNAPRAALIQANDGNFYGTTYFGGNLSLGTVFHRTPGVYETILDALEDTPAVVGIALGPGRDPTLLGPLPRRVHVQEWLPIPHLLDHAAAFVTHGGFNSVKEAMSRACRWS